VGAALRALRDRPGDHKRAQRRGFVVFALAAGNVDSLSERRRRVMYAAAAAMVLTAVVETAIIVAGGGYNAPVVPAFVLILGAAATLWYVRLAS
jgi:hypothetical protein